MTTAFARTSKLYLNFSGRCMNPARPAAFHSLRQQEFVGGQLIPARWPILKVASWAILPACNPNFIRKLLLHIMTNRFGNLMIEPDSWRYEFKSFSNHMLQIPPLDLAIKSNTFQDIFYNIYNET